MRRALTISSAVSVRAGESFVPARLPRAPFALLLAAALALPAALTAPAQADDRPIESEDRRAAAAAARPERPTQRAAISLEPAPTRSARATAAERPEDPREETAAPTRAEGAEEPPAAAAPPLSAALRLVVSVQRFEKISGEFHIDAAQRVTVPILGRVSVRGHTVESFERAVSDRVYAFTQERARVTVEVAEYQPVLVTGVVAKPGAVPWRGGVTALAAATLGGGVQRPVQELLRADFGRDRMNLSIALSRLKLALARRARLEAQRAGADRIETPAALVQLVGESEAQRLIRAERAYLINERQTLDLRRAAHDAAAQAAEAEGVNLDTLEQTLSAQAQRRAEFSSELSRLEQRGVVSEARLLEEMNESAKVDERLADVRVAKIKLEARGVDLERDRVELESERLSRIELELAELRGEIEQASAMYEAAALSFEAMGAPVGAGPEANGVAYAIARAGEAEMEMIRAEPFTALRPGDVVIVCHRFDASWPINDDGSCQRPSLGAGLEGLR